MNLTQIENLTFEEIKARRAELIEAIKGNDPAELAARYLQARADASQRDQTLGAQGVTITALQQGAAALSEKVEALNGQLRAAAEALAAKDAALAQATAAAAAEKEQLGRAIAELTEAHADQSARAERLKAEALRNQAALNGAAKLLHDAIGTQRVEDASK